VKDVNSGNQGELLERTGTLLVQDLSSSGKRPLCCNSTSFRFFPLLLKLFFSRQEVVHACNPSPLDEEEGKIACFMLV
jgi:hypothetical protein